MFHPGITTLRPRATAKTSIKTGMYLASGQQVYCSVVSLRSWEEGGDVAVFERDTFYIRLVPPETARTAIARARNGI